MAKRGRKTKFTTEKGELIIRALKAGTSQKAAAEIARIDEHTFYNWLKAANADDAPAELVEWSEQVLEARGEIEQRMTAVLIDASIGERDWKAAAWWLERRCPEYRPKQHIEADVRQEVRPSVVRARELIREQFGSVGEDASDAPEDQ